ncbi:MAG: flagellar hook protein [Lachnospiraceae bacterium]|nr:flagellar hook protein [Lachnospiraceae bacterium]MDE6363618.1 flagellar hook protein [Lachnospiraceae bacterium]
MVVQHNLRAMNSNRMLGITQGSLNKSTEKLSSGYKVNRAADDAAGLSISEKMRKQIRGLSQASLNAEDGISAVQTAEGALTEVHDMLQRMNELAVKAANGTNSISDRQTIQDEVDQLLTEIDRVAETTKFNELYTLKGDADKVTRYLAAHDAGIEGTLTQGATNATFSMDQLKFGDTIMIAGREYHISGTKADQEGIITASVKVGQQVTIDGIMYTCTATVSNADKFELTKDDLKAKLNTSSLSIMSVNGKTYYGAGITDDRTVVSSIGAYKLIQKELGLASSIGADGSTQASVNAGVDGKTLNKPSFAGKWVFSIDKGSVEVREDIDFSLHVGADADMNNKIAVKIGALDTKGLGIQGLNVKDPTGAAATYAIDSIADAVAKISAQRSLLGAVQNRLEHTINNLDNVVENTTAAESQIRDTDMATEMVKYSNNNVLAQAGQSMLAQSNQANQGVLSLLG